MIKYTETFGNDNTMIDIKLEKKDYAYILEITTTEYDENFRQKSKKTEIRKYASNNAAKNYIRRIRAKYQEA